MKLRFSNKRRNTPGSNKRGATSVLADAGCARKKGRLRSEPFLRCLADHGQLRHRRLLHMHKRLTGLSAASTVTEHISPRVSIFCLSLTSRARLARLAGWRRLLSYLAVQYFLGDAIPRSYLSDITIEIIPLMKYSEPGSVLDGVPLRDLRQLSLCRWPANFPATA
jgi:hypothetical protein